MEISVLKLVLKKNSSPKYVNLASPMYCILQRWPQYLPSLVVFFSVTLILLSWLWGLYRIFLGLSGLGTHLCTVKCTDDFWNKVVKGQAAFTLFPGNLSFVVLPHWGHHAVWKPKLAHTKRPHGETLRPHGESKNVVLGQPVPTASPHHPSYIHPPAAPKTPSQNPRTNPAEPFLDFWATETLGSNYKPCYHPSCRIVCYTKGNWNIPYKSDNGTNGLIINDGLKRLLL